LIDDSPKRANKNSVFWLPKRTLLVGGRNNLVNRSLTTAFAIAALLLPMVGCGQFKSKTLGRFAVRNPLNHPCAKPDLSTSRPKPTEQDKQELKFAMARSLERKGETRQAKAIYQELASQDQAHTQAIHRLAVVHEKEGESEIAKKYFQQAIAADPDNPELISDLGYSHYLRGDLKEAEKHLRKAIELDPKLRRAHNTLGMLLARTERESEAITCFRRGGCNSASAQLNLAFAQGVEGRFESAEETYRNVQQADPSSERAYRGLVSIQRLTERLAAAPSRKTPPETAADAMELPATWLQMPADADVKLVDHQQDVSDAATESTNGIRDQGFVESR
jgi:Flp pilus assembly protein TadD